MKTLYVSDHTPSVYPSIGIASNALVLYVGTTAPTRQSRVRIFCARLPKEEARESLPLSQDNSCINNHMHAFLESRHEGPLRDSWPSSAAAALSWSNRSINTVEWTCKPNSAWYVFHISRLDSFRASQRAITSNSANSLVASADGTVRTVPVFSLYMVINRVFSVAGTSRQTGYDSVLHKPTNSNSYR